MVDIKFHCDEERNFHKGFSVRAFTYTDYCIEMHTHDFYEVNIVLSGSGMHCIEKGKFKVKCGDVFVIPPMVAHAYTDTENLEVYHILLQKSFVSQNKSETENVDGFLQLTEIEPILRSNFSNAFFLHLNQSQLLQLKNELEFIDDNSTFTWEECAPLKYHTIWKILYWFSSLLKEQLSADTDSDEKKYEVQIISALEYIHKKYNEKITIETLCNMTFLSRSTFLRSFKAVCGISPIEYLNRYRCKKAIEQLDSVNCSKTEIANNCGFYDLSHMERTLKNYR
jgi:AraC family L-rhamnose operon transcriptional activator RhaR/AraC family L-rhamnose operon regulatory protein RhaS